MIQEQISNKSLSGVYPLQFPLHLGDLFIEQIDLELYATLKRQIWGPLYLHLWHQLRAPLGWGFKDLLLDGPAREKRLNLRS